MTKTRTRRPKLKIEFIREEFKKLGYTLISKTYIGAKQNLAVRCRNGHKWAVCWNNFSRGTRCKHCFMESAVGDNKTLKKIVLRDKFFSISEVARVLGVKHEDLRRHIDLGLLPGPTREFGTAKRYYKLQDIKKIEKLIE